MCPGKLFRYGSLTDSSAQGIPTFYMNQGPWVLSEEAQVK